MASFHTKTFIKHDDYMTPKYAWEWVKDFIPRDKQIWESFYGDGDSGNFLAELGFKVLHEPTDLSRTMMAMSLFLILPFPSKKMY